MTNRRPATYEDVVLQELAYESAYPGPENTVAKIKARLKRKKLGTYDPERVDRLRRFVVELRDEIGKWQRSEYYAHPHGDSPRQDDFDVPRLTRDFAARHPDVANELVEEFVPFAIYLYYLR
jgi:hypothetical protein